MAFGGSFIYFVSLEKEFRPSFRFFGTQILLSVERLLSLPCFFYLLRGPFIQAIPDNIRQLVYVSAAAAQPRLKNESLEEVEPAFVALVFFVLVDSVVVELLLAVLVQSIYRNRDLGIAGLFRKLTTRLKTSFLSQPSCR